MAQTKTRKRTTTALTLAALMMSLGVEPMSSEAQQVAETPQARQEIPPASDGGGPSDVGLTDGGTVDDDTSLVRPPPPQPIVYIGPPGSNYIFTGPPAGDYSFEPPGSSRCAGNGGLPLCQDGPVCCPDPNLVHRQVCCLPVNASQAD
ncbi:MAG: hypothetical protein RL326_609 [Pseudomonadota bacterium]